MEAYLRPGLPGLLPAFHPGGLTPRPGQRTLPGQAGLPQAAVSAISAGCQRRAPRSVAHLVNRGTEAGMNLAEYDSNRQVAGTKSGPVGYADVGSGRPALFVHGVGTSGLLWRNVIGALKDERRCIAVDLPLHGRTPARPGQDLSLTGLAKVVEDFCAALDLTGVDLVANDTGGAVAQIVAAHQAQRLATVTLTNCETPGNVPPLAFKPTVWLARAGLLAPLLGPRLLRNLPKARKRIAGGAFQDVERLPLDVVRAYLEPLAGTKDRARQFQRWIASLHDRDLVAIEPALKRLTVPTLMVWGTGDTFFDV